MKDWLYIALVILAVALLGFQIYLLVWTKRASVQVHPVARALRVFNIVALAGLIAFVLVTQLLMR